ncbi:MAG: hypothetical protein H6581_04550 [Bacteroidia bacterium]|nr:hypothetical protein [Bacteroidia bacterium]
MENRYFSILVLLGALVLYSCNIALQEPLISDNSESGDNYIYWESSKAPVPVVVASHQNGQVTILQPENVLKSFFSLISPSPVSTVAIQNVQSRFYLSGNESTNNYYFLLDENSAGELILMSFFTTCKGSNCSSCALIGPNSCDCVLAGNGKCNASNGVIEN